MAQEAREQAESNDTVPTAAVPNDMNDYAHAKGFEGTPKRTEFTGQIAGDRLEMVARHFPRLLDDVRLNVTAGGVFYRAVDSANVGMGELWLPTAAWDTYHCSGEGTVGVTLCDLYDVARQSSTGKVTTRVSTSVGMADNQPSLTVSEDGTFAGISEFNDLETMRRQPETPDFEYTTSLTLSDGNALREFAKSHTRGQMDAELSFTASIPTKRSELSDETAEGTLTIESSADDVDPLIIRDSDCDGDGVVYTGEIEYNGFGVSGDVHSDVTAAHADHIVVEQSLYSVDYLKNALIRLRKTDTKDVPYTLQFGTEYPMLLERGLGSNGHIRFWLAPRIKSD